MPDSKSNKFNDLISDLSKGAEERDAKRIAEKEKVPYVNLRGIKIDPRALEIVKKEDALEAKICPVEFKDKKLKLAAFNLQNPKTKILIAALKNRGFIVETSLASISGLKIAWDAYESIKSGEKDPISKIVNLESGTATTIEDVAVNIELLIKSGNFTTTDILSTVLSSAISINSSDIHFETNEAGARLRFRIDGILYDIFNLSASVYHGILNRIKLMSELKINLVNAPQDGRFSAILPEKQIEIRVSLVPSGFGETLVLRVLDPKTISLELKDLGLRLDDEKIVLNELKKPSGMILVTGPTGSGKTTTLYAFLKKTRSSETKTITIEDPIEYHLEGIEQTQVEEKQGYTFASSLRSVLRQDPDVILVGEIRDLETAEAALHASLTGHLVFSTLHTNSSAGAIPRLIDIGVKIPVISPALNLVISVRLIRKLCPSCREEILIEDELKKNITKFLRNLPGRAKQNAPDKPKLYKAIGCEKCQNGYRGRIGIFEMFQVTKNIKEKISNDATEIEIKKLAVGEGLVTIEEDAIIKVLSGITTLEEVERIMGPVEW